jgi:hypothetical protein
MHRRENLSLQHFFRKPFRQKKRLLVPRPFSCISFGSVAEVLQLGYFNGGEQDFLDIICEFHACKCLFLWRIQRKFIHFSTFAATNGLNKITFRFITATLHFFRFLLIVEKPERKCKIASNLKIHRSFKNRILFQYTAICNRQMPYTRNKVTSLIKISPT